MSALETKARLKLGCVLLVLVALALAVALVYEVRFAGTRVEDARLQCHKVRDAVTCSTSKYDRVAVLDGVDWQDHNGWHLDSTAACLPQDEGFVPVSLGYVSVVRNGREWKQAVWVDCR